MDLNNIRTYYYVKDRQIYYMAKVTTGRFKGTFSRSVVSITDAWEGLSATLMAKVENWD